MILAYPISNKRFRVTPSTSRVVAGAQSLATPPIQYRLSDLAGIVASNDAVPFAIQAQFVVAAFNWR
jgi:hypothetical protein